MGSLIWGECSRGLKWRVRGGGEEKERRRRIREGCGEEDVESRMRTEEEEKDEKGWRKRRG